MTNKYRSNEYTTESSIDEPLKISLKFIIFLILGFIGMGLIFISPLFVEINMWYYILGVCLSPLCFLPICFIKTFNK